MRHLRHAVRVGDGVRHGFLAEHVLVLAHGGERDRGVPVVGSGDVDGIDVLLLVEQLAIVDVSVAAFVGAGGRAFA